MSIVLFFPLMSLDKVLEQPSLFTDLLVIERDSPLGISTARIGLKAIY